LAALSFEQRSTLLLHELAHLRRRDHWVRLLEFVVLGLYWWNPLVWWARHELREVEEQCCDAWVVWAMPGAGRTYASALVECLDFLAEPAALPVGASGLGHVHDLKRRLTMILRGVTPCTLSAGGLLACLALSLVLPLWPTWAQAPPARAEPVPTRIEPPATQEDVEKARAELEKLRKSVEEHRKALREAEEKLMEAAQKLGKITGDE